MAQPHRRREPAPVIIEADWTSGNTNQAFGRTKRSEWTCQARALLARLCPILALYLLPTLVIGLELLHPFPTYFTIAATGFVAGAHTALVLFTETPAAIAPRMRTLSLLYGTAAAALIAQQITGFDTERMLAALALTAIGHSGFALLGDLLALHNPPHAPPWNDHTSR